MMQRFLTHVLTAATLWLWLASSVAGQQDSTYYFQHRMLPQAYYEQAGPLRTVLSDSNAGQILSIFAHQGHFGEPTEEVVDKAIDTPLYFVDSVETQNFVVYVIQPAFLPYRSPLCFQIGIVYNRANNESLPEGFFTLEKGMPVDSKAYNPFCSWRVTERQFSHGNYADKGFTSNGDAFVEAILSQLEIKEKPTSGIDINRKTGKSKYLDKDDQERKAKKQARQQQKRRNADS